MARSYLNRPGYELYVDYKNPYLNKIEDPPEHISTIIQRALNNLEQAISQKINEYKKTTKEKSGYVYVIKFGNAYKIGYSREPKERIQSIARSYEREPKLPFKVKVLFIKKYNNPETVEKRMHEYFKNKRLSGEFFALSNNDLELIQERFERKSYAP